MTDKDKHNVTITTRDRLMLAWQDSMELTRDFEMYSKETEDEHVAVMFSAFAEDEGLHAAKLLGLLEEYDTFA